MLVVSERLVLYECMCVDVFVYANARVEYVHIERKADGCGWLVLQPITRRMEIITIKVVCVRIVLKILFYQLPIMSEQVRLSCGDSST